MSQRLETDANIDTSEAQITEVEPGVYPSGFLSNLEAANNQQCHHLAGQHHRDY